MFDGSENEGFFKGKKGFGLCIGLFATPSLLFSKVWIMVYRQSLILPSLNFLFPSRRKSTVNIFSTFN